MEKSLLALYGRQIKCALAVGHSQPAGERLFERARNSREVVLVKGALYALSACFIWGLVFVFPELLEGYTPFEIAIGRFSLYGLGALTLFSFSWCRGRHRYRGVVWIKILLLSLISTFGCYSLIVLSVQYAGTAICALIFGMSPISIALYGNLKNKEYKLKSLILPSLLIFIGMLVINIPQLSVHHSPESYLLGVLSGVGALACWSWFVVTNARFLQSHPEVNPGDWATLSGVGTFVWVLLFGFSFNYMGDAFDLSKLILNSFASFKFWFVCAILGLLCSWLGFTFWNRASRRLPVPLTGQLSIFETVFAILFAYGLKQSLPNMLEWVGMFLFFVAIYLGLRAAPGRTPSERSPSEGSAA